MPAIVRGTFANGRSVGIGMQSDRLVIPSGYTSMALYLGGAIDASNTVKTRKSTDNGITFADVTTYNSVQSGTAVTVAATEQWILETVAGEASKEVQYRMQCVG